MVFETFLENIFVEIISEPIEKGLGKIWTSFKNFSSKSNAYYEARNALNDLAGTFGQSYLDTLLKELSDKGVLKVKANHKAKDKDFNRMIRESLDFNVSRVLELDCVKKLPNTEKKCVERAFKNIESVFIEYYMHTLDKEQQMFLQVTAYRLGNIIEDKLRDGFASYCNGLFEWEYTHKCPECGTFEREENENEGTAICQAGHRYTYRTVKKRSNSGDELNAYFQNRLDDISQSLAELNRKADFIIVLLNKIIRLLTKNREGTFKTEKAPTNKKRHIINISLLAIAIITACAALLIWHFSSDALVDEKTGITVVASGFDKYKDLSASKVDVNETSIASIAAVLDIDDVSRVTARAFDIKLSDGASTVSPEGKLTVSIPLTAQELKYDKNLNVYHQGADGIEFINSTVIGNKIEFETDHLSVYMIALVPYEVEFYANGGTPVALVTPSKNEGYKVSLPSTQKDYYELVGWYKDVGLTQSFDFNSEITADTTLYAKWTPIDVTVTFVDTNGTAPVYTELGAQLSSVHTDVEKGFKVTVPTPYKEGHTFIGWYLDGEKIDLSAYDGFKPRSSIYKLSAGWKVNSYNVTYVLDGEAYLTETYEYGEEIVYPDINREGHSFSGWKLGNSEAPTNMPAKDIKLSGIVTANRYTITFDTDGGTPIAPITKNFGEAITAPNDPTKIGNTFNGWAQEIPSTMPAENMTITANWTVNQYTITFDTDGGTPIAPITKDFGEAITVPKDPTRDGFEFIGWSEAIPTTMPADDMTITANWKLYMSEIVYNVNSETTISGGLTKGEFDYDGGINSIAYDVTQINLGYAKTYSEYYNFIGWCLTKEYDETKMLTDGDGVLRKNVSGYTNADRKWVRESYDDVTLYAQWEQSSPDCVYIENVSDLEGAFESATSRADKYLIICDIDMGSTIWTVKDDFSGELDGDGHCIYNFSISKSVGSGSANIAFIKNNSGIIKNLTIGKHGITTYDGKYSVKYDVSYTESSKESYLTVGGFVGENSGDIIECNLVNTYIIAKFADNDNNKGLFLYVGGIATINSGSISNCQVDSSCLVANATCPKESGDDNCAWLGGVCGINSGSLNKCGVTNTTLSLDVRGNGFWKIGEDNIAYPYGVLGGIVGEQSLGATITCTVSGNKMTIYGSEGKYTKPILYKNDVCGLKTGGTVS